MCRLLILHNNNGRKCANPHQRRPENKQAKCARQERGYTERESSIFAPTYSTECTLHIYYTLLLYPQFKYIVIARVFHMLHMLWFVRFVCHRRPFWVRCDDRIYLRPRNLYAHLLVRCRPFAFTRPSSSHRFRGRVRLFVRIGHYSQVVVSPIYGGIVDGIVVVECRRGAAI